MAGWKASLPPYATDLHYQQLNATQLNELIGKGGLWASQARREMARRERESQLILETAAASSLSKA